MTFPRCSPATRPQSRRHVLRCLGQGTAILLLAAPAACSGRATPDPVVAGDDDGILARLLAARQPHIPRRDIPWRVTRPLKIPQDTTVTIEPGTRFLCLMPPGTLAAPTGVFEATGDNVSILVIGGEAIVECPSASPFLYAAIMRGHSGFTVVGLSARECQHVWVAAATDEFELIRTNGSDANVARRVTIRGGGARYGVLQKDGQGACLLQYVVGCEVRNTTYVNAAHGVEWWGGNADPVRPPAQGGSATERKCRDLHIENVIVRNASGAGIWGSMGRNVLVRDCRVEEIGDVGFDAEGSNAVTFEKCFARNAHNGCFTTFFLCDTVRFIDCRGIVDDKAFPLFRVYNESQNNTDNKKIEIIGGNFECKDTSGPGTIDTAMGPVGDFVLSGTTLANVRIDVAFFNMHSTTIAGNVLTFPHPLPAVAAIRAGSSKAIASRHGLTPGSVTIKGNQIRYTASKGDRKAVAISLREDDFNGSAADRVEDNVVVGPFGTGVAVSNATANIGIVPSFTITANRFSGLAAAAALLTIAQEGAHARRPTVIWSDTQTRDGRPVRLTDALGQGY